MSYDLVFWRGTPREDPDLVWARLREAEPVEGIDLLAPVEVRQAFRTIFGGRVKVADSELLGPGFEVTVARVEPFVTVRCAWSLLESDDGEAVLTEIERVGALLGATVFDPQRAAAPVDPTIRPVAAGLDQLGPPRRAVHARPNENRAQSFATVDHWRIHGRDDGGKSLHSLFLRQADDAMSPRHAYRSDRLSDIVCDYVRLVQTVFPFEVLAAHGSGRASDGVGVGFSSRLLGIVDGKLGFLTSPRNTLVEDDGAWVTCWTGMEWAPTGPVAARRGPSLDLTEIVDRAAREAFAQARRGRTRALRDWIVLMTAIDRDGIAAEELFAPEAPPTARGGGRAFELSDAGAAMPVWVATPDWVEARLHLPSPGGFELRLLRLPGRAPARHRFDPPLGSS
jgi:hypothetical protein